jgi:predicted N-acyltransferase
MVTPDTEAIARDVFAQIATRFPALRMIENHDDPVEISITIPVQPGLSHKVWLCLQNHDELHFAAGHFWCE